MTAEPVPSAADLFNVNGLVAAVTGAGGGEHLSLALAVLRNYPKTNSTILKASGC